MVRQTRTRLFHAAIDPALTRHYDDDASKAGSSSAKKGATSASSIATSSGAGRDGSTRQSRTRSRPGVASDKGKQRAVALLDMADLSDSPAMARKQPERRSSSQKGSEAPDVQTEQADVSDTIFDPDSTILEAPVSSTSPLATRRSQSALSAALLGEDKQAHEARHTGARTRLKQDEERRTLYGSKKRRLERHERKEAQRQSASAPILPSSGQRRWQPPWPAEEANVNAGASSKVPIERAELEAGKHETTAFHDVVIGDEQDSSAAIARTNSPQEEADALSSKAQDVTDSASSRDAQFQQASQPATQEGYLADGSASLSSAATFGQLVSDTDAHIDSSVEPQSLEAILGAQQELGPSSHVVLVPVFRGAAKVSHQKVASPAQSKGNGDGDDEGLRGAIAAHEADLRAVRAVIWRGTKAIQTYFGTASKATSFCPRQGPPSRDSVHAWLASQA